MSLTVTKIIYRVTTLALAAFILPGLFFMNSELAIQGMTHVWLTDALWLQQILWYASPLAILAILIPKIPNRIKEWAYVGLAYIYLGAFWAHVQLGDTLLEILMPVATFAFLAVSYWMWHRVLKSKGQTL